MNTTNKIYDIIKRDGRLEIISFEVLPSSKNIIFECNDHRYDTNNLFLLPQHKDPDKY
jgi:hypothetical protein